MYPVKAVSVFHNQAVLHVTGATWEQDPMSASKAVEEGHCQPVAAANHANTPI